MYGSDYAWILIGEPEMVGWLESPSPENRSSRSTSSKGRKKRRSKRNSKKSRIRGQSTLGASYFPDTTTSTTVTSAASSLSDTNYQEQQQHPSDTLSHLSDESVSGDEHLSFTDLGSGSRGTSSSITDGDSISIRMGSSLAFGGNRVSFKSERANREGNGSSSRLNRTRSRPRSNSSRDRAKDASTGTESGVIRRLSSSSNPGTLRLKSSGKSPHQQHSHHHQSDCSFKQLMEAVQYAIVVDRYNILEQPSDSGMVC